MEIKREHIVCPYCNTEQELDIEADVITSYEDNYRECEHFLECYECGQEFEVCVEVTYGFTTYKYKGE